MGMSMHLAVPISSGIQRDARVHGSSCGTCCDVLHSHFDRKHHAARVFASPYRVMVDVSLLMVLFMA